MPGFFGDNDVFMGNEQKEGFFEAEFIALVTASTLDTSLLTITFTGNTSSGSATISSVSSTDGLAIGHVVTGSGIPANTTIIAFTSNTITLSANATATGTGTTLTAALYLYTWAEQDIDPGTGVPVALSNGRFGDATTDPLVEANNLQLPTQNPFYAKIRFRSKVDGQAVYEFAASQISNTTFNITYNFGSLIQINNTYVYFYGSPSFPTYVSFGPNVFVTLSAQLTVNGSCIIMSGAQPTTPANAPTKTVNGGGSGSWDSGTYFAKITYVDSTGAESQASPETASFSTPGSPSVTFGLNNSPPAGISYWRLYVTLTGGASNSEVLIVANAGGPTIYDIPIGTTSYTIPRPIYTSNTPPASSTKPQSCLVVPTCCGKPSWTGKYGELAVDTCGENDACANTNPTAPIIWIQTAKPTGTSWEGIFDYTAITGWDCTQQQVLTHPANASGLQWVNVATC